MRLAAPPLALLIALSVLVPTSAGSASEPIDEPSWGATELVSASDDVSSGRWIVTVDEGADETGVVAAALGVDVVAASDDRRLQPGVWVLDAASGRRAAGLAGVTEARPEQIYRPAVVPNDTCYTSCPGHAGQWHHDNIGSPAAWDVTTGDGAIVVAVLDSGIRDTHVDLTGRVSRVANCGLSSALPGSKDHGTHVAGLIGAVTDNNTGVAGMAWDVQLLDVRVLVGSQGFESDIILGLQCAADLGVEVINMSLEAASDEPSAALQDAVTYARDRGVIVVGAAGNGGGSGVRYPGGYAGVIGVVATDQSDAVTSFSDRGRWADIAAPGQSIVSLSGSTNFGVSTQSGTSFAAPLVAGAAALVKSTYPTMTMDQVGRRLSWTSAGYASSGTSSEYGLVDVEAAVTAPRRHLWQATDEGDVIALGDAPHLGDIASAAGISQAAALAQPIVAIAATATGNGYWLVASDGGVFAFGDAVFHGSTGNVSLNQPIVGMAPTATGNGYWLVASDGGIFAFGDAVFHGSTGNINLNQPIVGMTPTGSGDGYWLVASDGGIFAFGDAVFRGSTGDISLNQPIVGMTPTDGDGGYWLVASDGGIFAFGDAAFLGSTGAISLAEPVVGMTSAPEGYTLIAADGGVFSFGPPYLGSGASVPHDGTVVGATLFVEGDS